MDAYDELKLIAEQREAIELKLRRVVRAAHAEGRSLAEIALALHISKSRAGQLLTEPIVQETGRSSAGLDDLPASVRELVATGKLTPEVARQLNKLPDKRLVAKLARDAVEWNWTRRTWW